MLRVLLPFIAVNYITATQNPYNFIDARENRTNVYGAVNNVTVNSAYIHFLGIYTTTNECIQACVNNASTSNINTRCESYTYYTSSFDSPSDLNSHCYGRFGSPYGLIWTPIHQNNVNCGRIVYKCSSNIDCQFNGKCNTYTGNCTCNPAWKGYHCQQMNLLPASKDSGYHITNDNGSGYPTSSWGGAVLIDQTDTNSDTKYHMYVSEFDNHCGVNSWSLNSVVTHAQSTKGFNSPFKRVEVIHAHFAHEPDAINGPNNEIVLYYSAYNWTGIPECQCTDGSTSPNCKPPRGFLQVLQYAQANAFNGPWTTQIVHLNDSVDTNLAGVILKNGTFVGMMRIELGYGSEIHLVTSTHWKNTSLYFMHVDPLFPQLEANEPDPNLTEDPFIYIDCDGMFHAIFHNKYPNEKDEVVGGHAYSKDGRHWIYAGSSYSNIIEFTDGSEFIFSRRERPHFIFADDKCTPIALTTGVQYGGQYGDATYTHLQPLQQQTTKNNFVKNNHMN